MRVNITDINKINTCGYLYKNNWDYEQVESNNPSYFTGMKEVLRWHYKRGKPIDLESFMTFIGLLHNKSQTDNEKRIIIENAFRTFIASDFYRNMKDVYCNYLSDIKINKTDYLEHVIPFIQNPDKPTFIYLEEEPIPQNIFLERYDVLHNVVWSFYQLGKNATFLRIWFDGKEIKRDLIKTDDKTVETAKQRLLTLGKNLNIFVTPSIQTCQDCSMISTCERYNKKKRGKYAR